MTVTTDTDQGRALDESVCRYIHAQHDSQLSPEFRHPGTGLTPLVSRAEVVLYYRPSDGTAVASSADLDARPHAHRFIGLSTREPVSLEQLRAVRVMADGRVIQ